MVAILTSTTNSRDLSKIFQPSLKINKEINKNEENKKIYIKKNNDDNK